MFNYYRLLPAIADKLVFVGNVRQVLASFVVALPLMIKTSRAEIEAVDRNLNNASYTLGHSEFETATKVLLPLAKRDGGWGGTIIRALSRRMRRQSYAYGNILGKTDTMPLAIYSLDGSGDWAQTSGMVIMLKLMAGLFFYMANHYSRRVF